MTSDPTDKPSKPSPHNDRRARREARLEAELRANLVRRKDQVRRRAAADTSAAETPQAPSPEPGAEPGEVK